MSQDFNSPESQQEYNRPAPTAPKRNNTWIYIAIIAVLLVSNIYFMMSRNKISDQKEIAEMQFAESDSSRRAVEGEYNAALARLDELVSKNSQLDTILNQQDAEIVKLKKEISAIVKNKNATAAELGKAKRLISQLNSKVQGYEERIALLEQENADLSDLNTVLAEERDSAVTQNIGLEQKVRLGAVLHVSNIRMTPIDMRRGGAKQRETSKATKVDVLRILFDIDENRIAESGQKELFLRITGPDGNVLSNAAYGSGVTTSAEGASINYTLLKQVNLQQNEAVKNVTIDWKQDSDYKRGNYSIEIYHEGYSIGKGNVTLK